MRPSHTVAVALGVVAVAPLFTACGQPSAPDGVTTTSVADVRDLADRSFLDALSSAGVAVPADRAVSQAHDMCARLDRAMTFDEFRFIADGFRADLGIGESPGVRFMTAAARTYCPQHSAALRSTAA